VNRPKPVRVVAVSSTRVRCCVRVTA
jgi:hypothetical protein